MPTGHTTNDDLELYALDRPAGATPEEHLLADADAAPVEEHPLVCEECREWLARWDASVGATRAAMSRTGLNLR